VPETTTAPGTTVATTETVEQTTTRKVIVRRRVTVEFRRAAPPDLGLGGARDPRRRIGLASRL
jgi:hypothetical protein